MCSKVVNFANIFAGDLWGPLLLCVVMATLLNGE